MTELQVYDKDGLFHNIVKTNLLFDGRYTILPKGSGDLNANNVLSGIELPKDQYPLVACLPPVSYLPGTTQTVSGERFFFRLLFLVKSFYSGDNKIKSADPSTSISLHTISMDWNDMKIAATGFMNFLERKIVDLSGSFIIEQSKEWLINRISEKQVDGLSGVMLTFYGRLEVPCSFPEYDETKFSMPSKEHTPHYH